MRIDLAHARAVAVEAVLRAARLTVAVQAGMVTEDVVTKRDRSPVTVADYGAQAVVSHHLARAFPGVPLVGEEDSAALRADAALRGKVLGFCKAVAPEMSGDALLEAIDRGGHAGGMGTFWVLDPIDGTKGFLRRQQYAVCLALVSDGVVQVAVLGCPALPLAASEPEGAVGCLLVAVRGEGAFIRSLDDDAETRVSVSDVADAQLANFVESVEAAHADHSRQARVARALGITAAPVRLDSQCKFAAVARGDASLYLRFTPRAGYDQKIWDIAAGAMIIVEAGGRVTAAAGGPLNFAHGRTIGVGDLFASNGHLHDAVLGALASLD